MNLRTLAAVGLACGVAVFARGDSNIQYSAFFRVQNGNLDWSKNLGTVSIVQQGGPSYVGGVVSVNNSTTTTISAASLSTVGYAWFRNLSAGGAIKIGVELGGSFLPYQQLGTNEMQWLRLGTNSIVAQSSAGTNLLEYAIFQN